MRVLMSFLIAVTLALPALAQVREAPRDPDFYYPYDPHNYPTEGRNPSALPNPDLSQRPKPRDSRTLTGVFAPDPVGVLRMMGATEATSTCIGEVALALCAVETVMAAGIRHDDKLLAIAYGQFWKGPYYATMPPVPPRPELYWVYRVHGVEVAAPIDRWRKSKWWREERVGHRPPQWRVGDLLIDVLFLRCYSKRERHCRSHLVPTTYAVRQLPNGHWAVVDIFDPKF